MISDFDPSSSHGVPAMDTIEHVEATPRRRYTRAEIIRHRIYVGGIATLLAAAGAALVVHSGDTTSNVRTDTDIVACARDAVNAAENNGIDVDHLSKGALAQFAADCDPSSVDPLTPRQSQDHYLGLVDQFDPTPGA